MKPRETLKSATRVWLRVALLSFGGPAAQIGVMHLLTVVEHRWIGERRFQHALNFCMLLPGPEAMQLAAYIGWLMNGPAGALVAGGLFILPGALSILALSVVYALYGHVGALAALFFGLKSGVLAMVLQAVGRLSARSLRSGALRLIAAAAFTAIFAFAAPFPLVILAAGLVGFVAARSGAAAFLPGRAEGEAARQIDDDGAAPDARQMRLARRAALFALLAWVAPTLGLGLALGWRHPLTEMALFFSQTAVVTFGGAYAALSYVAQEAVQHWGWLRPGEMLDGLGLAETTPGPLIMVLQFVGFLGAWRAPGALSPLLAGAIGGAIATWMTFAPCFLWIFLGAPYAERLRGWPPLAGVLTGIGAAVVGVILNLAVWFAAHALFARQIEVRAYGLHFDAPDLASAHRVGLALAALALLAVFVGRVGAGVTLAACAAAGLALYPLGLAG